MFYCSYLKHKCMKTFSYKVVCNSDFECFLYILQCDGDSCPCKFLDCFRLGIWLVGLRVMKRFVFGNQFCQLAITSYFYSTASQKTKKILVRKCEMSRDDAYISSILYILKLPLIVTNYWKQTLLISDCTFFCRYCIILEWPWLTKENFNKMFWYQ